jgi:fimbrial isopeptide formation D2 family protein/uncharacterized repeat protein (TIGR01451 family)
MGITRHLQPGGAHGRARVVTRRRSQPPLLTEAVLGGQRGRVAASALILFLMAAILTSFTVLAGGTQATAVPGNPGTPGDPTVLFTEDFENGSGVTTLPNYIADSGASYTADSYWLRTQRCNGFILSYDIAARPSAEYCNNNDSQWNAVRAKVYALGLLNTPQNVTTNRAVSSNSSGNADSTVTFSPDGPTPPSQIQFASSDQLTLPASNRFVTFAVDAAATSCNGVQPLLRFYLRDDAGVEHPVSSSPINPCTAPGTRTVDVPGHGTTWYGTFAANSSMLLEGDSLGIVMRNEATATNGNDGAFDNIRVLDVTPQLDKSFSPQSVPVGGVSRLTFTVTNTSELAAKQGWTGTDVLESGLVVADPANSSTTCANGAVDATAGGDTIGLAGDLLAGQASCTFSIDVTSDVPLTDGIPNRFENCASNFPDLVGLNPPACTAVEFYGTPELLVEKSSDATADARPGDVVTYSVTATNTGDADFTEDNPAVVVDDLTGVLDDGSYNGDATATAGDAPAFADPRLSWTGALPIGESVTVEYTVTLGGAGDRNVRNVAFGTDDPNTPTPTCDPPVDGVDPDTGLPCSVEEFDLPRLEIDKSADRTELPAVGEEVTYTVTITNPSDTDYTSANPARFEDDLSEVLDDATLDESTIDASTGTAGFDDPTLRWSGALAAGQSATITYTVTYTGDGDNVLTNTACLPASDVSSPEVPCDSVQIPGSDLSQWKTASPSSDPLVAGSTVQYTLYFENDGEAAADIDTVDDLTHVVDDADVTVAASSPDGLSVVRTGDRLAITGSVPAGETHTVTYTVTIRPDGERGDDIAANFLLAPEDTPPTDPVCEPTNDERPDCTVNPIAAVDYSKSVEASTTPIEEGTELTYTVTVTNSGAATADVSKVDDLTRVLDDADVTSVPVVSGATTVTVTPVVDGVITIGGTIGAGQTATITYVVTVKAEEDRGDDRSDNFLVNPGETPPEECDPGSDECTSTPLPNVTSSKSVDPTSGTDVAAGDELTYTLTFVNDGAAEGAVDHTDHLADVLDDAAVTGGPTSSDAGVTATLDGETIAVTGTIAAGATVTVTYTVTVGADGERGNNNLGNFLVPGDEEPPTECVEGSALCTENPIGELADWKTVEASETPVAAGTDLTYTLHFENRGEGFIDVNSIDFLTHVLDDADVTAEPSSDDLTVVRDGETITINGSLEPGQSATVVYTVTVKADGARGDDTASNFLVKNDDPSTPPTPPTDPVCQPTDAEEPDCTTTPIGRLDTSKAVSASSDPIEAGTKLAYTLTFDNQSGAAVEVDKVDDLTTVLDDATVTTEPVSSDAALTAVRDGNAISVSGTLAAGQTVTVVYVVTVKEESERGDDVASNFLLNRDEEPPTECVAGDPNCTVTPLPNVDSSKSVDPTSGSTVLPGDVLTYTLTLTNSGEAAGAVHRIDYLAGVLDDAELTDGPTVSDPSVTAVLDGTELVIGGTLQPGQTATVTYTLTVLPDAERGDDTLTNFLFDADEEPPDRTPSARTATARKTTFPGSSTANRPTPSRGRRSPPARSSPTR